MALLSSRNSQIKKTPSPQSSGKAGFIQQYAGTTAPSGWLVCDGSAISRTEYADLFANIGTKYGVGDGSTTFNLPDGPRRTVEVDLDILNPPAGFNPNSKKGYCEQDNLGTWYLFFNIDASATGFTTSNTASIAGCTVSVEHPLALGSASSVVAGRGFFLASNSIFIQWASSNSSFHIQGRVQLAGKPTDAFVGADSFSTFDEALESTPIIKLYNDSTDGSVVAVNEATATTAGTAKNSLAADTTEQYLIPEYRSGSKPANTGTSQFTSGNIFYSKVGNVVTITSDNFLLHASAGGATTDAGFIPEGFRPNNYRVGNTFYSDQAGSNTVFVETNGQISTIYRDDAGVVIRGSTSEPINISYVITD